MLSGKCLQFILRVMWNINYTAEGGGENVDSVHSVKADGMYIEPA